MLIEKKHDAGDDQEMAELQARMQRLFGDKRPQMKREPTAAAAEDTTVEVLSAKECGDGQEMWCVICNEDATVTFVSSSLVTHRGSLVIYKGLLDI